MALTYEEIYWEDFWVMSRLAGYEKFFFDLIEINHLIRYSQCRKQ